MSAAQALQLGMVQEIGPRCPDEFGLWLLQRANGALSDPAYAEVRAHKGRLDTQLTQHCRNSELEEMHLDMVQNRKQFAEKCRNFVFKRKACGTPSRLVAEWAVVRQVELAG